MAKLNDESHDILVERRKAKSGQLKTSFTLLFMGDTHIQMCGSSNRKYYQRILKKVLGEKRVLATYHGGDGAHVDDDHYLLVFKQTTEQYLFKAKQRKNRIPLFMNVGNHEYIGSGSNPIAHYNTLIGNAGRIQTYRLTPNNLPVILEIILLDTGGPGPAGFPPSKAGIFEKEISAINQFIKSETTFYASKGQKVRFIIDMHIPPQVGILGKKPVPPQKPHYLAKPYNKQFISMLAKNAGKIIAIVTHHRHCMATRVTYKNMPFFITTHAGNCTSTGGMPRLEYLRLRLKPTQNSYQITSYKFTNV